MKGVGSRESIMAAAAELCDRIENAEAVLSNVETVQKEMVATVYAMGFADVPGLKDKIADWAERLLA